MSLTNILRNRRVNQRWQALCDQAIDANFPPKKQFIKRSVLANAVEEYCKYQPKSMEQIACKYGYPINKWDVSRVECFDWVFRDKKMFNENISSWDVSRAKSFRCMFEGTSSFNQDLSGWDTSTVTDMHGMFKDAKKFSQPLESWNTSRVANMSNMFRGAAAFNTICVTEMSRMFRQATSFNQCLLQWDTSCVRSMDQMFDEASSLDQDHIGSWNTSQVKQTCHMFQGPGAYYYASKSVKKSFSTDCVHGSGDMSPFSWRELAISRSEEILTLKEELRSVKHDGAIPILLLLAFDAGFLYASRMQSM
jgi:surface protein